MTADTGSVALILEGGGMRGLYTTGVLDAFLDADIHIETVYGVSAGASHALSYISRQRGRARRVNVDYCRRPDYMGLRCLLREGSLFGMNLLFDRIPYELDPYDFAAFEKNVRRYYAVATDIETGKPEYLSPRKAVDVLPAAMASCSLPFVSPPVVISGRSYLDGGISDSIPVRKALEDGSRKLVVVLTQPAGYRKGPTKHRAAIRAIYRKYPSFARVLEKRNEAYNECLDFVDSLERAGTAFVLRPAPQPGLGRLERDPEKLNGLHASGYADAAGSQDALREFIS